MFSHIEVIKGSPVANRSATCEPLALVGRQLLAWFDAHPRAGARGSVQPVARGFHGFKPFTNWFDSTLAPRTRGSAPQSRLRLESRSPQKSPTTPENCKGEIQ